MQKYNFLPVSLCKTGTGILLIFLLVGATLLPAQSTDLAVAVRQSHQGQYASADSLFALLVQKDPDHLPSLLGQAFNTSWQGKLSEAEQAFRHILSRWPEQTEALTGLAYVLAWQKKYPEARQSFETLLAYPTQRREAEQGLAFLALWEDQSSEAIDRFEALTQQFPESASLWEGLGLAYLQMTEHQAARRAFAKVENLTGKPTPFTAAIANSPAWMEVHLWGGFTQVNAENHWGLRAGQVSLKPHQAVQVWVRYDNSLSLDNADFLRRRLRSPLWYTGGVVNWNSQFTTRLELGYRTLPGIGRQVFFQGEQVIFGEGRSAFKLGGFYAPRADRRFEWLTYASGFLPLSEELFLEPSYFLSQSVNGDWGHRGQLDLIFQESAQTYRIQGGFLYGTNQFVDVQSETASAQTWGFQFQAQSKLGAQHWLLLLLRFESSPLQQFFTASIGTRLRIEK